MKYLKLYQNFGNWDKNEINENKYTNKELSKRFWKNYEFDTDVRKKLVEIAKNFYKGLDIDLEIIDVRLTGSLANFNYTDNSDLDLHIIVDFSKYDGDFELLKDLVQSKAFVWNLKHNINIRGADVEMYVQDLNEKHQSTGLFSLLNNKWIKKPEYTDPDVDEDDVIDKYNKWVYEITKLDEGTKKDMTSEDYKLYYDRSEKLKKKLKDFRKKGLGEGIGEFSVENIVFKKLRNNGFIEKLYNLNYKYYDLIFSQ